MNRLCRFEARRCAGREAETRASGHKAPRDGGRREGRWEVITWAAAGCEVLIMAAKARQWVSTGIGFGRLAVVSAGRRGVAVGVGRRRRAQV